MTTIPKFNIIYCSNNYGIIGVKNDLYCKIKNDLLNFKKITTSKNDNMNIIIMGYNTWLSIGEKPLPNRINIVIQNKPSIEIDYCDFSFSIDGNLDNINENNNYIDFNKYGYNNLYSYFSLKDVFDSLNSKFIKYNEIFIIGGASLYNESINKYKNNINLIYHTLIDDNFDGILDEYISQSKANWSWYSNNTRNIVNKKTKITHCVKFNIDYSDFKLIESTKSSSIGELYNQLYNDNILMSKKYIKKVIDYSFNVYKYNPNKEESQYLDLMKEILYSNNIVKGRNGNVISQFGKKMEFDLTKSFPLLTTKRVGWKTVLRELLWFINGSTDNKLLKDKKVNIWNANASKEFLESRGLTYKEDDLGPVYGFQWRHFGADYIDCNTDYSGKGKDQLKYIIDEINSNPNSRRLILNSWNASDIDKMALPPCHVMVQFNIDGKFIDCQLYQRSGDMFLGVPFNISSYSFLLCIIGHITGYFPRKLIHILGDSHIYQEHIDAVKEQLSRVPGKFPILSISNELKNIDNIKEEFFNIENYNPQSSIKAPMIA
jgi:dihydrofolate reductase/thymidylate synthase